MFARARSMVLTACAHMVAIFCVKTSLDADYVNAYFERIKSIRQTPDEILAPFRTHIIDSFGAKSTDEIFLWGAKQAYLSMGNLLAVCADLNIDAWPLSNSQKIKSLWVNSLPVSALNSARILSLSFRIDYTVHDIIGVYHKPSELLRISGAATSFNDKLKFKCLRITCRQTSVCTGIWGRTDGPFG